MRTMYDCAYLPNPAPRLDIAAGYLVSPGINHPWSGEDWRRAQASSRWLLPIAGCWPPFGNAINDTAVQTAQIRDLGQPVDTAVALDVEEPIAAQAQDYVRQWAYSMTQREYVPVIYCSATNAGLFSGLNLWLAAWNNVPHLINGTVATQYTSPTVDASLQVDLSWVADGLVLWDQRPHEPKPVEVPVFVGMACVPSGKGYWEVKSDGSVFTFGTDIAYYGGENAQNRKDAGKPPLNAPIVGIVGTPTGKGYWLVGSDGGVFAHGDAGFFGAGTGK